MEYKSFYLFDWLSFTRRDYDTKKAIDLLGLSKAPWQDIKGMHGYQKRKYYEYISVHYDGREPGIWCEMSGQGCRAFTEYGNGDYYKLLETLTADGLANITRIDLAFDDHDGLLDMKRIFKDTIDENYISKTARCKVEYDINQRTGITGITVYHGRKGSDVMIRIYDKAAERGITDRHWVRVEVQLRNDRAKKFVTLYLKNGEDEVGRVFQGVVNNYLRYVKPSKTDLRKRRWKKTDYWEKFITTTEKITLFKNPGTDYNYGRMRNTVVNQWGNAIDAMIRIDGLDGLKTMISRRDIRSNPKYDEIVKKELLARIPKKAPNYPGDLSGLPMGMMLDMDTGEITEPPEDIAHMFGTS